MPGHLYVDNKKINFNTRADYLVERGGMQYVAEVKTGNAAKVKILPHGDSYLNMLIFVRPIQLSWLMQHRIQ